MTAFVFVAVNQADNVADDLFVKTTDHNFGSGFALDDVLLQDGIESFVRR